MQFSIGLYGSLDLHGEEWAAICPQLGLIAYGKDTATAKERLDRMVDILLNVGYSREKALSIADRLHRLGIPYSLTDEEGDAENIHFVYTLLW